jgi:hypothetical protein
MVRLMGREICTCSFLIPRIELSRSPEYKLNFAYVSPTARKVERAGLCHTHSGLFRFLKQPSSGKYRLTLSGVHRIYSIFYLRTVIPMWCNLRSMWTGCGDILHSIFQATRTILISIHSDRYIYTYIYFLQTPLSIIL